MSAYKTLRLEKKNLAHAGSCSWRMERHRFGLFADDSSPAQRPARGPGFAFWPRTVCENPHIPADVTVFVVTWIIPRVYPVRSYWRCHRETHMVAGGPSADAGRTEVPHPKPLPTSVTRFSISRQTIARRTLQRHLDLGSLASKPRNWRNYLVNCELKAAIFAPRTFRPELE